VRFVKLFASAGHENAKPRQLGTKLGVALSIAPRPPQAFRDLDYDAARATVRYSVSRSMGSRPAALISRAISRGVIDSGVRAPAMW